MNRANCVPGLVVSLALAAAGCGGRSYVVTRTGAAPVISKAPDCDFAILTTRADRAHEEVAVLEQEGHPAVTAAEFQRIVRKQVCELGGDAVVAEIDDHGAYLRGTVLVWNDASSENAAGAEPAREPPTAPDLGAPPAPESPAAAEP